MPPDVWIGYTESAMKKHAGIEQIAMTADTRARGALERNRNDARRRSIKRARTYSNWLITGLEVVTMIFDSIARERRQLRNMPSACPRSKEERCKREIPSLRWWAVLTPKRPLLRCWQWSRKRFLTRPLLTENPTQLRKRTTVKTRSAAIQRCESAIDSKGLQRHVTFGRRTSVGLELPEEEGVLPGGLELKPRDPLNGVVSMGRRNTPG